MTTPRIDSGRPETIASATDLINVIEASNREPAAVAADDAETSYFDDAVEAFDSFTDEIAEQYIQPYADVLGSALDDPSDEIRNLQDGQTRIIEASGSLKAYEGVGGSVGGGGKLEVTRTGDDYEASFEVEGRLAVGLGVMLEVEGAEVDANGANTVRVTVRGHGDKAREELAQIASLGSPTEIAARLADANHVELTRLENTGAVGVGASAKFGINGGAGGQVKATQIADFRDGEWVDTRIRYVVEVEGGVDTVSVEASDSASLASVLTKNPEGSLQTDVAEALIEANGGVAGLRFKGKASLSVEKRANEQEGQLVEVTLKGRAVAGGHEAEATVVVRGNVTDQEIADLAGAAKAGPGAFAEAAKALGFEVEGAVDRVDFEGFEVRGTPFFEGKNGLETRTPVWQFGVIR